MEEAPGVRSVDVAVLISAEKKEPFQSDESGVHVILQSDRGLWQLSHWATFMLTALCCSWQVFSPAFLVPVSECISVAWGLRSESSTEDSINWTAPSPKTDSTREVSSCFTQLMISNCSGRNYSATYADDLIIVKCTPVEDGEFSGISHDRVAFYGTKYHIAAAKSVYMLGNFVAIILVLCVVNRIGQRCSVFCGFLLFYMCSVASSLKVSVEILLTLRFFLSLGITSVYWITLQQMLGSVVPDYRLLYGVIGHIGWAVGYMSLPLIAWCTTDWFSFHASISIPCLLLAAPLWYFPESVDYLLRRGKIQEAVHGVKAALRKNGRNADDVSEICHQSYRSYMKRSPDLGKKKILRWKEHLGYRNLLYYASSFAISFLYYVLSWNFYLLAGDPFVSFAWAGAMEILAVLLLIFFGYFTAQRLLFFFMAVGVSVFPVAGMLLAVGEAGFPVYSYMAAKCFAAGAVILIPVRAFEESSFLITAAVMSIGAAIAPLLDQMIGDYYGSAMMMMTSTCITYSVLGILSAAFPLHPPKCSSDRRPLSSSL